MIKAEVICASQICDEKVLGAVSIDAKGKYHELVAELGAIITTFNDNESYHSALMDIIEQVLKKNLDDASKELEKLKREKENK